MTDAAISAPAKGVRSRRNALGLCLLACMLLGGGTHRALLADAVLQIFVIAASGYALMNGSWNTATRCGAALLACMAALAIFQIAPLPLGLLEMSRPEGLLPFTGAGAPVTLASVSLSISRTVDAAIFAMTPVVFFIALSSLPRGSALNLVPFFMIGLLCNLVAAGLQYSFSGEANLGDLLGYDVMVGMFANRNHFATLVFSSIPLIIYFGFFQGRALVATLTVALIFLVLLAAGSRAGILIGLGVLVVSVGSLLWRGRLGAITMAALFAIVLAFSYGALVKVGSREFDPNFGRLEFAETTWRAVKQNWLLGAGFGTFDLVYPFYENPEMVFPEYVNHAHNDFLEVALEGGVAAVVLFLAYVAMAARRVAQVGRQPLGRLVFLSILVILLHSVVDYPLRTMAIAMIFAFLNALLFSDVPVEKPAPAKKRSRSGSA